MIIFPGAVIGQPNPTVVFTDNANNPNILAAETHTYSSLSIGAASSRRTVLVVAYGGDGSTVSGVTVGGVSATEVAAQASGKLKIFALAVPTGTTATVVMTCSGFSSTDCVAIFATYDLRSTTPVDVTTPAEDSATSKTLTLSTAANGVTIGFCHKNTIDETATAATWSGMTEHCDVPMWRNRYSAASAGPTTAETRAVSVTWSNAATLLTAISASFR